MRSYSFYKKDHTIKILIGVSPSGMITYLSKAYGGRASDTAIFNKEKIIELLIPGHDAIMVDKGLLIDNECKSQFSKEEAEETAEIARARVHVERRIQRLKNFTLLKNSYSWTLLPLIDDILVILAEEIRKLEPTGTTLVESLTILQKAIDLATKAPELLQKIAKIHTGDFSSVPDVEMLPEQISSLKYVPVTSCDVRRSFSNYKQILSNKLTKENLEKLPTCI
ncbi:hypothetical protein ILUMI_05603 [Ignelater luminosus]|uniref:DDE Tnp4 domain-containing protein n=1 Tax=Ignelater luminosus TaxID=2038154 RepID=A0A8K0DHC8_IGNLU|nr:hypothetical protein ILUMI_05603 [Ignelater luminosus]